MDDLKKACDESSKETKIESVAVVTVTRLKLWNDVNSRRGRREKCRSLKREIFYDDSTIISGSWVQGIELYGDIIVRFKLHYRKKTAGFDSATSMRAMDDTCGGPIPPCYAFTTSREHRCIFSLLRTVKDC